MYKTEYTPLATSDRLLKVVSFCSWLLLFCVTLQRTLDIFISSEVESLEIL